MKTHLALCYILLISSLLSSCGGGSIKALNARVEKQIVPTAPVPGHTSDASMEILPNGDLLYLNKQEYYPLIVTRYSDSLSVRWVSTIDLLDDRMEWVDWDALRIGTDSVCVFSTFLDEDGDDSAKYYARMISLADGGSRGPVHLFTFPLEDKNLDVIKMNTVNAPYGRLNERERVNAYHSPDKRSFLISTYQWPTNGKTYPVTLSLFSHDLTLIKKTVLEIPVEKYEEGGKVWLGEEVIAAVPTNNGDILITTYKSKTRTLRFIRYAMTGDGKMTEMRHIFEDLKEYDEYSFKFTNLKTASPLFHIGVLVFDPPGEILTTGNADFGAFYLGSVDFDKNALKFTKYAPTESQVNTLFGKSELQNVGFKYLYSDESTNRILAVFEEAREYIKPLSRSIVRPPGEKPSSSDINPFGGNSKQNRTTYSANNILLTSFDMEHNLIWERGINKETKAYNHLELGCATSVRPNNTLSLWYPSNEGLHLVEMDLATGKRLSSMDKEILVSFFNIYFLPPFSVLDKNNNLYFVARHGQAGGDSYLLKVSK